MISNDPKILNEQLMQVDAGYWATAWGLKLQSGRFSFKDHEYQIEPMGSQVKRKCTMKATQGGFTEIEVVDSLHGMRYGLLPSGVLYLFPTADDVNDFSKSRFNPMITKNKEAIGKFVKNAGKGTDTAGLKTVNGAMLYLRGARLSQKISDINESTKLKSIPVDRVVFDEVDHMDEDVITKAVQRMAHSRVQQERYLSNPIVPGEGIDKIFGTSDQRYWFRKCQHCTGIISTSATTTQKGVWTCAEKFFDEDKDRCVGIRTDGTGYIACRNCGRELPIWNGLGSAEWVPDVPSNSDYMHGYHWSQLTSVFNDPMDILRQYRNPPHGNLADVIRLRLGRAFIPEEDRLLRSQVFACCNNDDMYFSHDGPCAMGVDVGEIKHVIIGARIGSEQYQIYKMVQFSGLGAWKQIHDLAQKFNVKSAVIDIRPDTDMCRQFQNEEPYQVSLCEYSDNAAYSRTWDTKKGIVKDYRTALFDETHRWVVTPGMLTIPRNCHPEVKEFAEQMANAYKLLETNKKTGARAYRYKGKKEHYRNALNYFLLASSGHRTGTVSKYPTQQYTEVDNEYDRN